MSASKSSSSSNGRQSVGRPSGAGSLYVKVKYNNTLPDLPFDPKFLINPLDVSRFVDYETTSLERDAKHELLTPPNLGVDIDLILPERYAIPTIPEHDQEDERLLNEEEPQLDKTKKSARDKPHSQLHNKVVPWLKKTEYISTEFNRYGASNEKTETKVGYNVRKNLKEEEVYLDKESQIKAINATFEAAKQTIDKHPTKAGVTATRVLPLLPDFDIWKYYFAHVKFDSEPADPTRTDQMSQAIMKGAYDDETKENFVIYFLPTEITMTDRLLDQRNEMGYTEGKEYEYKSTRDYCWSAKTNLLDDFFFVFREDAVYYNRLSMEVTLKKRRIKNQGASSTLVVKHRELNDEEISGLEDKLKELNKPVLVTRDEMDLTAQALEQSYEDMAQERKPDVVGTAGGEQAPSRGGGRDGGGDSIESPNSDNEDGAGSSSSVSSSASSSSSSASASSSSSEESAESADEDSGED